MSLHLRSLLSGLVKFFLFFHSLPSIYSNFEVNHGCHMWWYSNSFFSLEKILLFPASSLQHVPNILLCILAASCPRGQLDKWRHQYWRIADTGRREGVYLFYIIVGQVEWKKRNDSTVDNDICLSDFYAIRWEIIYEDLFGSMNNVYVNNGTWISPERTSLCITS